MSDIDQEIKDSEENSKSSYCHICDACGEELCCNPKMCQMHPEGDYCQTYLKDLKFGYQMFRELYNLINEEGDRYQELLKQIDELWDKNQEKIYSEKK